MEQTILWDFIPECENGRKAESHLYFNEDADRWHSAGFYPTPKMTQMDIFDFLDLSVEELYNMSDLRFTTEEQDRKILKYLRSLQITADKTTYVMLDHEIGYLFFKHGWCYMPVRNMVEDAFSINNALKDRTGKKEPQNSFFNHESVFLKGLNKMFERRNRHGKNILK